MSNRRRIKNSERIEVITSIIAVMLLMLIVFTPFLADKYNYSHAQYIFNERASQYNKKYAVTAYHVKGGDTLYSISNSLYEEYGKEYNLSERDIYYGIRSINNMQEEAEASCIYAGTILYVPVIE